MTDRSAGTVAGAVAERRGKSVDDRARAAESWFGVLGPSHTNPAALVQLSLAQLSRVPKLREAADQNPDSFLSAMAECARLGLMPGDTYFYVPFWHKGKDGAPGHWEVTGIVHWTGEVELMYRTGEVEAVVVQVVRAADQFAWDPSTMRIPEHHIAPNESAQVGLADETERGKLTGVYCYVRFHGGGTSFPTVMTPAEVAKHRKISKSGTSFWGPDYPAEGPWTPDMWRKTAAKKHRGSVPTSPEYRASVLASVAAVAQAGPAPAGIDPAANREELDPGTMAPPMALEVGNGDRPAPGTIAGAAASRSDARPMNKGDALNRLADLFRGAGLGEPAWRSVTFGLAGVLAVPQGEAAIQARRPSDLTADQARQAVFTLGDLLARCQAQGHPARDVLLRLALAAQVWDGEDPAAPDDFDPHAQPEGAEGGGDD